MTRHDQLKKILQSGDCFKMICGAGNEDPAYVKKLALIYTLAGAKILDVSCNVDVIKHAMEGIDLAFSLSKTLGVEIEDRPFIMASVGMPGDHHVRKSYIDPDKCIGCTTDTFIWIDVIFVFLFVLPMLYQQNLHSTCQFFRNWVDLMTKKINQKKLL